MELPQGKHPAITHPFGLLYNSTTLLLFPYYINQPLYLLQTYTKYNNHHPHSSRQEFEELELQVQQSELPLKSYLQQIGVSYSTYHYWRRKCSVDRSSIKHELAPISFKQAFTESSQEEQLPHGVALLFPNGLRAHFGSGSEDLLKEIFTQSLRNGHV